MEVIAEVLLQEFNEALYQLARATGKEFGFVVKRNSRLLAINLAIYTQPWAGREGNFVAQKNNALKYTGLEDQKLGVNAVLRDIGRVYRTIDIIFEQIQRQSKNQKGGGDRAARAFYAAAINGNIERAQRILRSFRIHDRGALIAKFDKGIRHQARRNRRGRVQSARADIIVTNPRALQSYANKITKRVGVAKGGWAGAANGLGGMRGLPQWVTRHKAGGHALDFTTQPSDPHAILVNDVPWIDQVLNANGARTAVLTTQTKMMTHIRHVVGHQAQKAGFAFTPFGDQQPLPAE